MNAYCKRTACGAPRGGDLLWLSSNGGSPQRRCNHGAAHRLPVRATDDLLAPMLIALTHRTHRYFALLILALAGLLALPLQAQHNHRGVPHTMAITATTHCAQHLSAPTPTRHHSDHNCQCLLACASAAVAIATAPATPPQFALNQPHFIFHTTPLPLSPRVPPYRPPIKTFSV